MRADSKSPTAHSCRPRRRPGRQKEGASACQTASGRQPLLCPSRLPPDRPQARFAALENGTASGLPHSVRRKPHLGEGGALRSHRPPHEPVGGTSLLKQGEPSRWASMALTTWAVPLAVTQGGASSQTGSAQSLRGPDILARPGLLSSLPAQCLDPQRHLRDDTLGPAHSRLLPRLGSSSASHPTPRATCMLGRHTQDLGLAEPQACHSAARGHPVLRAPAVSAPPRGLHSRFTSTGLFPDFIRCTHGLTPRTLPASLR